MTFSSRITFLFFLVIHASGVVAQQPALTVDEVFGSDPLLYNGRYYTFYTPFNTGGNQYHTGTQFEIGSATIRGVKYSDLLLNFDIYNQEVILKYKLRTGATNLIIVSDAWVEAFSLNNIDFEIVTTTDTVKKIFQVIGNGPDRILYYWRKSLNLDSFYGASNYTFSEAKREMYILIDNKILKYTNNKSFYKLFDTEKRVNVKDFMRNNNIRVKKAPDQSMRELIDYCNTLSAK